MTNSTKDKENFAKPFLQFLLEDNRNIYRFIIGCASLLAVIGCFTYLLFANIYDKLYSSLANDEVSVSVVDGKWSLSLTDKAQKVTRFLLPASSGWYNSGIQLKPGEEVEISAGGVVHLSIEKLVDAAQSDIVPIFDWVQPYGTEYKFKRQRDSVRREFLLCLDKDKSKAHIGEIVACLYESDLEAPPMKPRINQDKDLKGKVACMEKSTNNRLLMSNNRKVSCNLWLAINDIVLDSSRQAMYAYIGDKPLKPAKKSVREQDKYSSDSAAYEARVRYWSGKNEDPMHSDEKRNIVFYYDNLGEFLVAIKRK